MAEMNIEELDFEVKTYNRLKKAGINTVDELLAAMYSTESKVSQPDAKRCEAALKEAGIIRYMRGDTVAEDDVEPEPLTWDDLHSCIGRLVVHDCSTESHRWLKVCWIYDIQDDGEGNLIYNDGSSSYGYARRSSVNGDLARDFSPFLKYEGRFFALKESELSKAQQSHVIVESAEYTRAVSLHRRICANAQAAQESLYEMCKALKEMRDSRLYKELGYSELNDYCKSELGMSDRTAYKYISIAENFAADDNLVKSSSLIGREKLVLLAKLDEPQREELQQTVNVEEVSVRELKAKIADLSKQKDKLIDELKQAGEEKAGYKDRQDKLLTRNKELVKELEDSEACRDKLSSDLNESRDTVMSLEKQIEELESKPVDAYENTAKINELTAKISEMEVENAAKLARLKSEYESKTAGEPEVCRAVFQAYLTSAADALHRLCDFAEEHKLSEEFNYYIARINKLISHAESETARIGGK